VAVFVTPPGEAPSSTETESIERAALGQKPAGSFTRTVDLSATVEAVDLKNRNVTLRGPKGNAVTLKVGDHVKRLGEVKVGDTVAARYTEDRRDLRFESSSRFRGAPGHATAS
jgi:hypothetical protein